MACSLYAGQASPDASEPDKLKRLGANQSISALHSLPCRATLMN